MKFRILFLMLGILASSCVKVEVCEEEYRSELEARFKTMREGAPADTTVSALSIYGIREGENDSLLYDELPASGFSLPLDPHREYSSFVLQIDTLTDTLHIYHEHEVYMISYSCGFASLFTLDRLQTSTGLIEDDSIINNLIDAEYEDNEVHVWLYL